MVVSIFGSFLRGCFFVYAAGSAFLREGGSVMPCMITLGVLASYTDTVAGCFHFLSDNQSRLSSFTVQCGF